LFQVETVQGAPARNGSAQYYDRLIFNQRAGSVAFRTLLLPMKAGEKPPDIGYDAARQTATINWGDQTDTMVFKPEPDGRTLVTANRGGETLLENY
jgi:hypothetical protein